ncbi:MAG: hypothetical protein J6Y24_00980 [Bacteroidales bacterium]|nr:hypothetical protein [Bacteroidales bacterium]
MTRFLLIIITIFAMVGKTFCQDQENLASTLKIAVNLSDEGKFKESNDKLITLLQKDYLKDLVSYNLSVNYFKLKDYAKAQKYAQSVMDMNSEYMLHASVILGKCLNISKKYTDERKAYDRAAQKFPTEYLPHYCKAKSFTDEKKTAEAYQSYIEAIKRYNFGADLHFDLAQTLYDDELYIHSALAYCFYLLTEPKSARSVLAINKLAAIMNVNDADRIIAQKTANPKLVAPQDEDLISSLLFLNSLQRLPKTSDPLPAAEPFLKNIKSLLTDLSESITDRNGFYETFYLKFFAQMLTDNMLDEYLYFIANAHYDNINDLIPSMTRTRLITFADWLQKYFENNELE